MAHPSASRTSRPSLSSALEELASLLLATESFQTLVQSIAELFARTIPGALTCGITMANGGRVITVGSADQLGSLLDEQQYEIDEGPCLEALRAGYIVDAPNLATDSRWPGYRTRAMAQGVSAVYSSPLVVRGAPIGVVNLYGATPHAFDGEEQRSVIADLISLSSVAITGSLRNYGDVTLTDQLQSALSTRSVIDQAIGIIMATQHCTAEQAFAVLRSVSQTRNVRLAQIAQDLVERTVAPDNG